MSQSARVHSLEALERLRLALLTFAGEAGTALDTVAGELRRVTAWLEGQLAHWQAAVRRCEDELFLAKEELARRQMMKVGGRPVDCTEQLKAVRKARAALEHAQDMVQASRRWIRDLPDELIEYEGVARNLRHTLEARVPRAAALLEDKVRTLESYLDVPAPPRPAGGEGGRP